MTVCADPTSPVLGATHPDLAAVPIFATHLLAASLLALLLASCLGLGRTVVEVDMSEGPWLVRPERLGDEEVAFKMTNTGSEPHQPVVVLTNFPPDELPVTDTRVDLASIHIFWPFEGDFSEWPPDHGMEELFRLVEPGQTLEDAPRALGEGNPGFGTYVVFCYLPGHYEKGEYGTFEITEDAS